MRTQRALGRKREKLGGELEGRAPLRRHPAGRCMLAALMATLVLPASGAAAKPADPLAGMRLDQVASTLTIKTPRPPSAGDPAAPACGHLKLESTFKAGPKPKLTRFAGQQQNFPTGLQVAGTGNSTCTSESPSSGQQQEPGGLFDVGTALHVVNKSVPST